MMANEAREVAVAGAEAGEEVVVVLSEMPTTRMSREADPSDSQTTLAAVKARRRRYGRVASDEIRDWIAEGRA